MQRLRHTSVALCSVALFWFLFADVALAHDGDDHVTLAGIPLEGAALNIAGVVLLVVGLFWLLARGSSTVDAAEFDASAFETDSPPDERSLSRPHEEPTP